MVAEAGLTEDRTVDLEIDLLLEAIHRRYQHDFRHYSRASLRRRLERARGAFDVPSLSALQHLVLHDSDAFARLLSFLTITVSDLFRDPEFFAELRRNVIPVLATYPSIKVWSAGCATGEELYSLAILFAEEGLLARTLFYGTDIDAAALAAAERGIYAVSRAAVFSRNYRQAGGKRSLADYYTAAYDGIVFDRALRRSMVISDHSLATDSVFSEVHLVICRNVLIYFDSELQDRAIGLFAEALIRRGFLGLGSRESLVFCAHRDRFAEIERAHRLYQKL